MNWKKPWTLFWTVQDGKVKSFTIGGVEYTKCADGPWFQRKPEPPKPPETFVDVYIKPGEYRVQPFEPKSSGEPEQMTTTERFLGPQKGSR